MAIVLGAGGYSEGLGALSRWARRRRPVLAHTGRRQCVQSCEGWPGVNGGARPLFSHTRTLTHSCSLVHTAPGECTHTHAHTQCTLVLIYACTDSQKNTHPPGKHTHSHTHPGACTLAHAGVHGCQVHHGRSLSFWPGAGEGCHQLALPPCSCTQGNFIGGKVEAAISWTLHQAQGSQVPAQRPGSREAAAGSEHM